MPILRAFPALVAALAASLVLAGETAAAEQGAGESGAARPRVLAVVFENDVNPVTSDYLTDAIDRAARERYDAVVILTDTPGGLDSAMRDVIKKELEASLPVVLYVYPAGARAASAGVFLAMAADVAAMVPESNIGSSTPIAVGGGQIPKDARRKVVNDAAAYLRSLAEEHGRNGDWAEEAVRVASNLTARQALARNVVDVVAPDLPSLLDQIDGRRTKPKGLVLRTANAEVTTVEMSLWKRILDTIIDPNIVVLLMSLGVLGITVELLHPGLVFPAAFGGISLILGLFGLHILPVSWAGIVLLLLALGFFGADIFVTSHGALTLAGAASFVFGALLLFDPAGDAYQVSLPVALAIAGTFALFAGFAVTKILETRRRRPETGEEELAGQIGVVRETLDPLGLVFVHGELWRARAAGGEELRAGVPVRVERLDEGLVLEVRRVEEGALVR